MHYSDTMYDLLRHGISMLSSSRIWSWTGGSISAVWEGCIHTVGGRFASTYVVYVCWNITLMEPTHLKMTRGLRKGTINSFFM